ncbi:MULTISPECIES: anti-sigma factor [unclassified Streptomyces]|uniref:anti-sigma factor family protein n=1 Tax=unclassified Streptomyces TaxID=2593676 RepID=UPI00287FF427|nr:anti-sigma factor [Streptomyces sp. I6]
MKKRSWWRRSAGERRMNCLQVARLLQSYLDGETDEVTARRVAAHLEDCRRCGLEASVYEEIRGALSRRGTPDAEAVARLRIFGEALLSDPPAADDGGDRGASPSAGA